ncbi:MAG: hypothetical protein CMJ18_17770 [Phycisphaeraceae bacterium]|nr:hypothetical protein [Phycisphaeraceae bacterium]
MNHILLVEDNVDNQMVIEDLFELDEIDGVLVTVSTAEDALRRVREVWPILILMDIGLPGMSGLEATRLLKQDEATRHIRIWALTAHAMKKVQQQALEAGCDDYLTKPICGADLVNRVNAFLANHGAKEAA